MKSSLIALAFALATLTGCQTAPKSHSSCPAAATSCCATTAKKCCTAKAKCKKCDAGAAAASKCPVIKKS